MTRRGLYGIRRQSETRHRFPMTSSGRFQSPGTSANRFVSTAGIGLSTFFLQIACAVLAALLMVVTCTIGAESDKDGNPFDTMPIYIGFLNSSKTTEKEGAQIATVNPSFL